MDALVVISILTQVTRKELQRVHKFSSEMFVNDLVPMELPGNNSAQ